VPGRPNSWVRTEAGSLIARLGEAEFLLEDMQAPGIASAVGNELSGAPGDVYPVLRQDLSLLLHGQRAASVLLETCSLDFRDLKTERGDLALTSMLGVSVLVVPVGIAPAAYRIWADPSFGPYLWDTLLEIVASHGGGAAGWSQLDARCLV
jgi:sarcosine oxidase subunit gamma